MKRDLTIRWMVFIFCCVAIPVLCGLLLGVDSVIRFGLFFGVVVLPLITGSVAIYRFAWYREKLATVLVAGLLGYAAFTTFLWGLIFDPDSAAFDWWYLLLTASEAGIVAFLFALVIAFVYGAMFCAMRRPGNDQR